MRKFVSSCALNRKPQRLTVSSGFTISYKHLYFLVETSAWILFTLNLIHEKKKKDGQVYQRKVGLTIYLVISYLSIAPKPCPVWERNHLEMRKYCFTGPTSDSNPLLLGL